MRKPSENKIEIVPTPDTRVAWLYNRERGRWTLHDYRRTERAKFRLAESSVEARAKEGVKRSTVSCWAHVFRCRESGVERRWGVE